MKAKFRKIDTDSEFVNEGYNKYVQNVQVEIVDKGNFDGILSLCIDARLPVTKIYSNFDSKESKGPLREAELGLYQISQTLMHLFVMVFTLQVILLITLLVVVIMSHS